jgi:hypothetical protein
MQNQQTPGKTSKQVDQEVLPSRHAMSKIVKGDPYYRSIQNYAKVTPADASGVAQMHLAKLFGFR